MIDYAEIEGLCKDNSAVLAKFVDDFLLNFCADRERLPEAFIREFEPYEHIVRVMPMQWTQMLLSQYIAHRLFRHGGLARKYRTHPAILSRSKNERAYLEAQITHPWRWCFSRVLERPHKDFFEMEDVCTEEIFLLYSPGMTRQIESDGLPMITLLLVGNNGACWQTYGTIMPFMGLFAFDPLFVAQQINLLAHRMDEVPAVMDRSPLPFAMLWHGGNLPAMVHRGDFLVYHRTDLHRVNIPLDLLRTHFRIEKEGSVVHLSLKYWSKHPHFAEAFYDEKRRHLLVTAMTNRGYEKLVAAFAECNVKLPATAHRRGSMAAVSMISKVFGYDPTDHPYQELFAEPVSEMESKESERINRFLALYVQSRNDGTDCDIDATARSVGLDPAAAREIVATVDRKFRELERRQGRGRK
ncbi:MAG: hypothetical protein IH600_05495 [Bacteroidetes bacterium]|nr:hypothetical protein [Bacteroidota bacterium]